MKKRIKELVLFVTIMLVSTSATAYDFEVNGIYYNITSQSNLEVEVTYKSLSYYEYQTYKNDSYEGEIVIPQTVNYNNRTYTVTGIGTAAFGSSSSSNGTGLSSGTGCAITSISLPETIVRIKGNAFQKCESLYEIQLPSSLTVIGEAAFSCSSLRSVNIPDNVEVIGSYAFRSTELSSVIIGKGVKSIGTYAFQRCSQLSSVVIGKGVNSIGKYAFDGCSKLLEVFCLPKEWPQGVSQTYVFCNCHANCEIYVPSKSNYGFGIEYLTFGNNSFQYNGMSPRVDYTNNLKAYDCSVNEITEKGAGTHTTMLTATYSNGVDFSVEIPYTYTISPASLTLTVKDSEREYGEENPAFSCEMAGFVEGESAATLQTTPQYTCEAKPTSDAGSYRILASIDAKNYDVTYNYGTLVVKKAPITMAIKNATRLYGNNNPQFEFTYSGLKNNEATPTWITKPAVTTEADKLSKCGVYELNVNGGEATNYDVTQYIPGELTVNKRVLAVKANNAEKQYGEENPDFTISYAGFVNFDDDNSLTEAPSVKCDATKESDAGSYAITVSGGQADNYTFAYTNGTLTVKPLKVGFKNVYNTVTYNDMSVSSKSNSFKFVPEIVGEYDPDDFWLEIWALDKEEKYTQHVTTISGGEYAGKYINYDGPTYTGKYIFNLTTKGTNPNVTADPGMAYLTVNKAATNLEWDAPSTISVGVGESVDLGISYQADLYCKFSTEYDGEIIEISSESSTGQEPHWYAKGLKEGTTNLSFGIECIKNDWGFYNFSDSRVLSKTIKVVPNTGIADAVSEGNAVKVYTRNGNIVIDNKPADELCRIYNLQGKLLMSTKEAVIDGLGRGVYVVVIKGQSNKVAL